MPKHSLLTAIHPPFIVAAVAPTTGSAGFTLQNGHIWVDTSVSPAVYKRATGVSGGVVGAWVEDNPGPAGAAGSGVRWLGSWNSGASYVADDLVVSAGTTYIAIAPNTNDLPPSANWNVFAAGGATGATGAGVPTGGTTHQYLRKIDGTNYNTEWDSLTSADLSDFDTQVRTSRLDQLAAPTADVSMNSHKLTNVTTPSGGSDAATKGYVDGLVSGVTLGAIKEPVRAATVANGTLATAYENGDTLDGVTLATGDRILLKDQTTGSQNGIYVVAASGAPARASDFDTSGEVESGALVVVSEGTVNADRVFVLTTNAPITLGTTALAFAALGSLTGALLAANNLSDLASVVTARTNLGLAIGSNVQAWDTDLDTLAGLTATTDSFLQAKASAWTTRTPTQVTADLIAVVGDSGSGGTKGLVPAPGSGDAAAGKFLKADGTFAVPPGSGMTNPMTTQDDLIVGGTSGTPARLAKGADSQVLTVDPTTHHLVWATPASGGLTDPMTTAGDVIIRNGSNVTARLGVPSSGPNGRVLGVVSGVPAWIDEVSSVARLWDDLIGGNTTSASIGALGWQINGGGPTLATQTAEAGHPGLLRRGTGASSGNVGCFFLQNNAASGNAMFLPVDFFDIVWIVRLNTNDANTTIQIGTTDTGATLVSQDGIYIEKQDADTSFFGVCRAAGVQTRTAALLATDTSFHKFRMRRKDASTISFSIDGGAEVDVTTHVPTAGIMPGLAIKNSTASTKTCDIDAFAMTITGLSR